jgi:ABC-type transport system substrate-binding protein
VVQAKKWLTWVAIALIIPWLEAISVAQPAGSPGVRYVGFSLSRPPGNVLAFRQALASAIDRAAVIEAISPYANDPRQAHSWTHPDLPGYNATITGYPYDPVAAKRFWDQLPATGRPSSIRIAIRAPGDPTATPAERQLMVTFNEAVSSSIARILGIPVNLEAAMDFRSLAAQIGNGGVPIYMLAYIAGPYSLQTTGGFALGFARAYVKDPDVTAAVEAGDGARVEALLIREKVLVIPIAHYKYR